MEKKNIPYVKEFDSEGNLLNPIKTNYLHDLPNRKARREPLQSSKFYGESNNFHLTVTKQSKHKRVKQYEVTKEGKKKVIEHYILQN